MDWFLYHRELRHESVNHYQGVTENNANISLVFAGLIPRRHLPVKFSTQRTTQLGNTCSKLIIETLEQGVEYVQCPMTLFWSLYC